MLRVAAPAVTRFVSKKKHTPKIIFTFATASESPKELFKRHNIPVLTIQSINSGILNRYTKETPYIAIVTGVGSKKSMDAANCINQNFQAESILNIGSCGSLRQEHLNQWIIPKSATAKQEEDIILTKGFPCPFPQHVTTRSLYTTDKPNNGPNTSEVIDMETYYQAKIFKKEKNTVFYN